ncbi:hypothetical protein ATO12_19695 [Aquimarina atlantica]|uniref:Crystallin n=1 Tax=Aquimarina atlantica TaxID=1317122 RepID=A0A023BTG0_9FLAO|nr:ADP-ribosylglycohydrolase family protein [Aquimarina atlantica]EZH73229.1 hypothetical protein ATO12_19695 [Aquimarina atlantica]
MITKKERFLGSMFLGAIGDAIGSGYENVEQAEENIFYPFGKPEEKIPDWNITDDTQLTLATCEALIEDPFLDPQTLSSYFISYFTNGMIRGIGASTLKAFRELQIGLDWSQTGRRGEYSAGNGAAMRIAPIAFFKNISRERIEQICSITHYNSEAYVGALAVILAIKTIIEENWINEISLMELITSDLPDSKVKDRLLELDILSKTKSITEIASLGNDGYVVNSVPFSIFSANMIKEKPIDVIFDEIINSGGDTDTNCSITGQIVGTYIGYNGIPEYLKDNLKKLSEYSLMNNIINRLSEEV